MRHAGLRGWRRIGGRLLAAAVCSAPPPAWPQSGNSGAVQEQYHLGAIATFATELAAKLACGGDDIVWAERYAGYFYRRDEARYALAPEGADACRKAAYDAGYWGTDLMDSLAKGTGKSMKLLYPGS